ncbi:MAG: BMP family ABC transporter substrate-binding protein [Chloroflexaceae bacterium]|nr:BMP family ABC transporter substrate-binding protein [Chloroflexaceae bacterium]
MRIMSYLLLVLLMPLLLLGCGEAAPAPAAPEAPAAEEAPFRVAVVMPSGTTDLAWSQAMYDALVAVQAELGGESAMQIAYSENMFNVTDAAAALRDYAAEGNDLVIAHGTQYGTSLFEVAADFPETSFAWGTAIDTGAAEGLSNVFAYNALAAQGGFVNGVIAAQLTESKVIGVIGPVEAGDAKDYVDGFVNGVASVDPSITVQVAYTGSFGDTALAAETANVQIAAGADVLTGSAQQVVGAIGVAKENNVLWLGTQSSQSSLAPEIVVSTQLYDWGAVISDMIAKHQAGELGGEAYELTLENEGLKMSFNDGFALPAEVAEQAAAAQSALVAGSVDPLAE